MKKASHADSNVDPHAAKQRMTDSFTKIHRAAKKRRKVQGSNNHLFWTRRIGTFADVRWGGRKAEARPQD